MKPKFLKPGLSALGAAICLASLAGAAQDNADIDRKMRELSIMDNIFEAALNDDRNSGAGIRRVSRPESMYLAGQGMVFTFRLMNVRPVRIAGNNFDQSWVDYMKEMMESTRRSLEQVQASFPDLDFDFDYDFDFDNGGDGLAFYRTGQAVPQAPQAPFIFLGNNRGPEREAMQEMEEAMRETQEQIRDQQREIRSMERDLREAQQQAERDKVQARIDSLEASVDSEMANLEKQQQAYETFITNLEASRRDQQLAMAGEATDQVIGTLCDYGATLRSLGDNEHVTVILEDVVDDVDQVYVFSYKDIGDCRSADNLKQKAVAYEMRKQ